MNREGRGARMQTLPIARYWSQLSPLVRLFWALGLVTAVASLGVILSPAPLLVARGVQLVASWWTLPGSWEWTQPSSSGSLVQALEWPTAVSISLGLLSGAFGWPVQLSLARLRYPRYPDPSLPSVNPWQHGRGVAALAVGPLCALAVAFLIPPYSDWFILYCPFDFLAAILLLVAYLRLRVSIGAAQ